MLLENGARDGDVAGEREPEDGEGGVRGLFDVLMAWSGYRIAAEVEAIGECLRWSSKVEVTVIEESFERSGDVDIER